MNEEAGRGRRLGAEKMVRQWLVRRKEVSRLQQGGRHGEAQVVPLSVLEGGQKPYPREAKKDWKSQGGITSYPLSEGQWGEKPLDSPKMGIREAQQLVHSSRRFPEPCCHRWLLGVAGKWGACGWSVVPQDHDEEMGPMHGMYGMLDADLDVQRTIKRAELTLFFFFVLMVVDEMCFFSISAQRQTSGLTACAEYPFAWQVELEAQRSIKRTDLTAFLCLFKKAIGLTMVHVDNKGIIYGLWRGEMRCIGPRAQNADLWILIWEELHRFHQEGTLVEVEHVKAHRTEKERQQMSLLENFITQDSEKADEFAQEGAMMDGGLQAHARASSVQQEREVFCAALQDAASFHCLVEEWKDCEELKPKPKEKWTFVNKKRKANKYRCMEMRKKQQAHADTREM